MLHQGFGGPLTEDMAEELVRRAYACRGAVLTATSLAESGHPGGSFSSMELFTVLYGCARLRPEEPRWPWRDRIVISHGHTSPGVYTALAAAGFFPLSEVEAHFRQAGSPFEGHVERSVPGVEWSSGNLGQGLSAGVGMALAARLTGRGWHTFVAMSDGEQHKGQVSEARRLAMKEGLTDLTVVVDVNGVQISGRTSDVMPVHIAEGFRADGWRTVEIDGHDIRVVYDALADAVADESAPVAILARTHMGKGVTFMEDEYEFHGRGLTLDEYARAMQELGLAPDLEDARARRHHPLAVPALPHRTPAIEVRAGEPCTYDPETNTDNRSAWGKALMDIAEMNPDVAIAVLDCDLAGSVKTEAFWKEYPDRYIECGVGEHNAAVVAGALSVSDVLTFWADFGVFGLDEAFNQQRLNDINGAAVKLALTHCGIDVGEDGKTHQCIDYVGSFRELFGWRVMVPADPNQTDRAVRHAAGMEGCVAVAMGRSKLPVILSHSGDPLFGGDYEFTYGRIDWAREGGDGVVLAMGTVAGNAVRAVDVLADEGVRIAAGVVSSPLDLDHDAMTLAARTPVLVTVEDHNVRTGLGASVAEWLATNAVSTRLVRLGIESYQSSGTASDLLARAGLDAEGIADSLRGALRI